MKSVVSLKIFVLFNQGLKVRGTPIFKFGYSIKCLGNESYFSLHLVDDYSYGYYENYRNLWCPTFVL